MSATAFVTFAGRGAEPAVERPSLLTRGVWEAPPWAIGSLGISIVFAGGLYLVWRVRGHVRRSR